MLDQATLKELLHYDPETGVFTWKVDSGRWGRIKAGTEAGNLRRRDGYRQIKLKEGNFLAHRLAFLYMTGDWPEQHVDHIDGNPLNNRWCNLRDVDRNANMQNLKRAQSNNKSSGLLGVSSCRSKWQAHITVNSEYKHLGTYDTPEEAHDAYLEAKRQLHGGCTI